jgi:hypothetical protein
MNPNTSPILNWSKVEASPNVPDVDSRTMALIRVTNAIKNLALRVELEESKLRGK